MLKQFDYNARKWKVNWHNLATLLIDVLHHYKQQHQLQTHRTHPQ